MYKKGHIQEFFESVRPRQQLPLAEGLGVSPTEYAHAVKLYAQFKKGEVPLNPYFFEAMSLDAFPLLFRDILSREALGLYKHFPKSWPMYFRRGRSTDYRKTSRFQMDGAEKPLDQVRAQQLISEEELTEKEYQYQVQDHARIVSMSTQVMKNNDLDTFNQLPFRLMNAAARTEEQIAAKTLCDTSGPHATHFTAANNNIVTGNPALTSASLKTAIGQLLSQVDEEGEPIAIHGYCLVVGPTLLQDAQRIIEGMEVRVTPNGSTETLVAPVISTMHESAASMRPRVAMNPYIPRVATTNGDTTWFLIGDPNAGRAAGEIVFLDGMEDPSVTYQESDIANGRGFEAMAQFDTNLIRARVLHTVGGGFQDARCAIGSNGSGG